MANAPLDENGRPGITAALNTDGQTVVAATVNPSTHALKVADGSAQTDNGNNGGNALLDENGKSSWFGLASDASGEQVIVYTNSSGAILIQTT